jgi:H+/gluconate symporter-like permease
MKFSLLSWIKYLVAIVLGQALYFFVVAPHLPPAARHERFQFDLGTVIDFWFCLFVYGLIELLVFLLRRAR